MQIDIDVSDLPAPQPLERILDCLADLPPAGSLLVRHRRDPLPLYPMLRRMGFEWETRCLDATHYEILIRATAD